MIKLNNRALTLLKKCWMVLAAAIIILAILFTCFRALTPWAEQYKSEVETQLTKMLGHSVQISAMKTSWYWFEPVLKLENITIFDQQQQVLKLDKLLVGFNLLSSLWHWQLQPGILFVEDVSLSVREVDNHWQIDGLGIGQQVNVASDSSLAILGWLLAQQKIMVKNVSALVHLKDGSLLPITNLNVTVRNHSGRYHVKGYASLAQTTPTTFSILADMRINPSDLSRTKGEIYLSVANFLPAQWQNFFPLSPYYLEGGKGDIELWMSFNKGRIQLVQSEVQFQHMAISESAVGTASKKYYFVQSLAANLAWKPIDDGWQLAGDHVHLHIAGKQWPENKLLVKYRSSVDDYAFYLQTIDLETILSLDVSWPDSIHSLAAAHPFGVLHDTQFQWIDNKPGLFLTRFDSVGVRGNDVWPGISGVSGVFSWEPDQGRLDIDSHAVLFRPKNKPELLFSEINAGLDWKSLSHGLRVNLERFVLTQPDLILSGHGQLEEALTNPKLNLEILYSAQQAEKWLGYIPNGYLKDKLEIWLKKDIKKITKATGRINVKGQLADFPFDKSDGVFTISSYLSGVDLYINDKWPIAKDIDAYLRINKRDLTADVVKANLGGVDIDRLNLRIDDIGYDRETLLIHTKNQSPAKKLFTLVYASPLSQRLAKLKMIDISGSLGLDLRLEIPLYPENDTILASGTVDFSHNNVVFHHSVSDIELKELTGELTFDEKGIVDSAIKALLLDDPIDMRIQSVRSPAPHTEVRFKGHTTIDLLKDKADLPIFALLKGELDLEALVTITDDPDDLDHLMLLSTLNGTIIDLPPPLGKSARTQAPLKVDIDFNPEKAIKIRFNYADKLGADLWFERRKQGLIIERGEVRLGSGKALAGKKSGVNLVGTLPEFDLNAWHEAIKKIPEDKSVPSLADSINHIDVKLQSAVLGGQTIQDVLIKANKANKNDWSLNIKQPSLAANLFFQSNTNTLSGHFDFLHLPKFDEKLGEQNKDNLQISPNQIPNLNLTINDLKIGAISVGNVIVKSHSTRHRWQLEYCKILSPSYQMTLSGDWTEENKKNKTRILAELKISDLGAALELWDITPAVVAQYGEIEFKGDWNGPVYDFSLPKIQGGMNILIKNGRITKLSPETEEKIGLGKLLSILSLQTIPRRLTLDFSDLAKGGYSFDIFKGKFALKNGVMNTGDSYIDGPVAFASIKGDLDLKNHLYDLDLHVSPHITASLPVVATIAGGPVAGIAAWVANKLINQGMQKISGYTYKITGPWLDPVIQQVSIIQKGNTP